MPLFKHLQFIWSNLRVVDGPFFFKIGFVYDAEFDEWLPVCGRDRHLVNPEI